MKLVAAVAFVVVVAVTPRRAPTALAFHLLTITSVAVVARLPARFVGRRLTVTAPFLATAAILPFVAGGPSITVGPLTLSEAGSWAGSAIAAKTVVGALTSIVLAGTTPTPEMIAGLGRLRLPTAVVGIASFMIRYLDLAVDELGRRRTAMAARAYRPRWLGHARPTAAAMGTLFVRSYERGERVHAAMVSRGYRGAMPTLIPAERPRLGQWLTAAALPLTAAASLMALTLGAR